MGVVGLVMFAAGLLALFTVAAVTEFGRLPWNAEEFGRFVAEMGRSLALFGCALFVIVFLALAARVL